MSSIAKMEEMCKQLKEHHMIKGSSYHTRSQPDQLQRLVCHFVKRLSYHTRSQPDQDTRVNMSYCKEVIKVIQGHNVTSYKG